MTTIDATYSFFSSPELDLIPSIRKTTTNCYVKRESTRTMSQPEEETNTITSYQQYHPAAQANAVERWVLDASYGYFSSPSLHQEPIRNETDHGAAGASV